MNVLEPMGLTVDFRRSPLFFNRLPIPYICRVLFGFAITFPSGIPVLGGGCTGSNNIRSFFASHHSLFNTFCELRTPETCH
jgi:hypothetical protein